MSEPTYRIAQRLHERRAAVGFDSYGEHLKPFNKRCSLIDAIEECADQLVYLLNMAQESRHLLIDLMANSVRLREAGHAAAADGLDKIIVGMGGKETLAQYEMILGTVAENATVDPLSDPAISTLHKFATTELPQIETITTSGSLPTDPRDEALRVADFSALSTARRS